MIWLFTLAMAEEPSLSAPTTADPAPATAAAATAAPAPLALQQVILSDGQRLYGSVTTEADGTVVLVLTDGKPVRLAKDSVFAVRAIGESGPEPAMPQVLAGASSSPAPTATPSPTAPSNPPLAEPPDSITAPVPADTQWWERDPNRGRYFFGPSAYSLGHLNGYVAQKEIALTNAAIGLSDYFDVSIGTVVPTLFVSGGQVVVLAAKGSVPLSDLVHVAVGGQLIAMSGGSVAMPFGALTFGEPSRNVTVAGGLVVPSTGGGGPSEIGILTVSGVYRFGPQVGVISENWILLHPEVTSTGMFVVPSGGVRFYGKRFAIDVGAVVADFSFGDPASGGVIIPLPWLDFTYNWSLAKEGRSPPK